MLEFFACFKKLSRDTFDYANKATFLFRKDFKAITCFRLTEVPQVPNNNFQLASIRDEVA